MIGASTIAETPLIILAGGQSRRMGTPKGLLTFDGNPWLIHQIRSFWNVGGKEIIVVLGHEVDRYFIALPWLELAIGNPIDFEAGLITTLVNPEPDLGAFSSVIVALNHISSNAPKASFLLPIDVPAPNYNVWVLLLEAMNDDLTMVAIPTSENRGGHPLLLGYSFIKQLIKLEPSDELARLDYQIKLLQVPAVKRVTVTDKTVRLNFNTPSQWLEVKERLKSCKDGDLLGKG